MTHFTLGVYRVEEIVKPFRDMQVREENDERMKDTEGESSKGE